MQVVVDSLLTNYVKHGSGRTVILFLHGWADSSKTFDLLVKELIGNNKGYQVVALDLPGFGASQHPPTAWGLEDYAQFVAAFLKKTGIKPNVIIGHSNGGAIAIKGLANELFQAEKLVLIASAGIRAKSLKKTMLMLASKPAKIALVAAPPTTRKRIRRKLYSSIGSDYLVAEHMQETFKKIVSEDIANQARKVKIPALLIYGQNDTSTPPAIGKKLAAALPEAVYNEIPLAGHFVHQEQVYKVARLCEEHIRR